MNALQKLVIKMILLVVWGIYRLGYLHGRLETRLKVMIGR